MIFLIGFYTLTLSLNFQATDVASWFQRLSELPYAIPGTVLIYTVAAFAGAPQWMLHGGSVLAFGPVFGSFMAWISTLVSASFDFWLGRRLGSEKVGKFGGDLVRKFIAIIRRHGFWTSLTVRVVPSGPFVVINMAAGVAGMTFLAFLAGTAIGIIPKIIAVAFFGGGIQGAATGKGPIFLILVGVFAFLWIGMIYLMGARLKRKTGLDTVETKTSEE
ncbi:MAG: TVP38/TMEM64 family protein [Acidimicrobiales bacterium]|nr:TVP38/TMEM64 family protein [Hyphomonadaceae bacterium]RZV43418.1 MAG: TVP38/TMEM64 family protein [Acidimicrobiales bacterium]